MIGNVNLHVLAREMRQNSERWFPDLHAQCAQMDVFYALGMGGEVGEVLNLVKKSWRGTPVGLDDIAAEIADTFTYLLLLADELDIDIIDAYRVKVSENDRRWG